MSTIHQPLKTSEDRPQWEVVDDGWGHSVVEFATLLEPGNAREYVALHQLLSVSDGDRVLDVACGSGLALEFAGLRGARCAGIDASARLLQVAADRMPGADLRVGDMQQMPWGDESFDVVTSFRGIWATTLAAIDESYRVLRGGGRLGITSWGDLSTASGAWALAPFLLASPETVDNQLSMIQLGDPAVGTELLASAGFVDVEAVHLRFVWEFPDPTAFARALTSSGPSYEAVREVGEAEYLAACIDGATPHVRRGLPLRAEIPVVAYLASKPST